MSRYLLFAILAISAPYSAHANSLKISTQKQFDDAVDRINKGEEMHMRLTQGTYVLHQSLNATAPLTIKGERATITNAIGPFRPVGAIKVTQNHYVYKIVEPLSLFSLFYDDEGNLLYISESVIDSIRVNYTDGFIEAPDHFEAGTQIKIPFSTNLERLKNKTYSNAYGYLDCGWSVVNFKLDCSDEKYFYCTTLNNCLTKNYNYDKDFYKKPIRYVIYNAELTSEGIYFDNNFLYVPKKVKEVYFVLLHVLNYIRSKKKPQLRGFILFILVGQRRLFLDHTKHIYNPLVNPRILCQEQYRYLDRLILRHKRIRTLCKRISFSLLLLYRFKIRRTMFT